MELLKDIFGRTEVYCSTLGKHSEAQVGSTIVKLCNRRVPYKYQPRPGKCSFLSMADEWSILKLATAQIVEWKLFLALLPAY